MGGDGGDIILGDIAYGDGEGKTGETRREERRGEEKNKQTPHEHIHKSAKILIYISLTAS